MLVCKTFKWKIFENSVIYMSNTFFPENLCFLAWCQWFLLRKCLFELISKIWIVTLKSSLRQLNMRRKEYLRSLRNVEIELELFYFVRRIFESNKLLAIVEATYSNIDKKSDFRQNARSLFPMSKEMQFQRGKNLDPLSKERRFWT